MLHPRDRARGFDDGDEVHLAAFRHSCTRRGINRDQVEGLIDLYPDLLRNGINEYTLPTLQERAKQLGADWDVVDDVVGEALGHAQDGTVPDYTPPSATDDDATIGKAEALMAKDNPAYQRDAALKDEYLKAIGRREARMETFEVGAPSGEPVADGAAADETTNEGEENGREQIIEEKGGDAGEDASG